MIEKSGASFSYMSKNKEGKAEKVALGRGYDAARTFLRDGANKTTREKLLKEIIQMMETGGLSFSGTPEAEEEPEE